MENQSPRGGVRQVQRRTGVFEDTQPIVLSDDYALAELLLTRADAVWGPPIDMRGRDEVLLLVKCLAMPGLTGLTIAFQDGFGDSKHDLNWYDRHGTWENANGVVKAVPPEPGDLTLDVASVPAGPTSPYIYFSVPLPVFGHWMRFKPFGAGVAGGSLCVIEGLRVTRAS